MKHYSTVRLRNISLAILLLAYGPSVYAAEFVANLRDNSFDWKDNEYVCGGYIVIENGIISNFKQTRIIPLIHTDSAKFTSRVNLLYHAFGADSNKENDYPSLKDWFTVKTNKDIPCIEHKCSFEIRGELSMCRESHDVLPKSRKVSISNSDFILQKMANH
jgi:hypothetical protein